LNDTIVHCKTIQVGDVVRTPVPRAPWRTVTAVDHESKTITYEPGGTQPYGRGYVWLVLRGRTAEGNHAQAASRKEVAHAA
jgi:hypothetical protein